MEDYRPGFRFYPTEEELVGFYLHNQLQGQRHDDINRIIPVIDIVANEPWDLPKLAGEECYGETEQWFFFTPRQERELRGGRSNRTTTCGYWKVTGSPAHVYSSENKVIGIKKNMVFYQGKAPSGRKTKWKMHEYKAIQHFEPSNTNPPQLRHEFSLCRVYVISGKFGSFDRRPLERAKVELQIDYQQVVANVNGSSPSPTSYLGKVVAKDHDDSALIEESSGTNWNVANNSNWIEEPQTLWEWEQLNWI